MVAGEGRETISVKFSQDSGSHKDSTAAGFIYLSIFLFFFLKAFYFNVSILSKITEHMQASISCVVICVCLAIKSHPSYGDPNRALRVQGRGKE